MHSRYSKLKWNVRREVRWTAWTRPRHRECWTPPSGAGTELVALERPVVAVVLDAQVAGGLEREEEERSCTGGVEHERYILDMRAQPVDVHGRHETEKKNER